MNKDITILIPTYNRPTALTVLLTSLSAQTYKGFDIVISDQSDESILMNHSLRTVLSVLREHGNEVKVLKHLPRMGIAEQRSFLLKQTNTKYCLFLDDDLLLESWVVENLRKGLIEEGCGFIGQAAIGMSYQNDFRPHEEEVQFWNEDVTPEEILPNREEWQRYKLHSAANVLHVQKKLSLKPLYPKKYKVAWIGACVLYDTQKLQSVGGFEFWKKLPKVHCGEDILAQLRVMEQYGGCGQLPSGVYHQELPTTIQNRKVNAPEYLH